MKRSIILEDIIATTQQQQMLELTSKHSSPPPEARIPSHQPTLSSIILLEILNDLFSEKPTEKNYLDPNFLLGLKGIPMVDSW